jgi:hypothetical protein
LLPPAIIAFVSAGLENIPEEASPAGPIAAAIKGIAGRISFGINFLILRLAPEKNPIFYIFIILLNGKIASLEYMLILCILLVFLFLVNLE